MFKYESTKQRNINTIIIIIIRYFVFFLGALISAGFEVSATVLHDTQIDLMGINSTLEKNMDSMKRRSHGGDASSIASTNKKTTDHLIDSMVDWLTKVPENEL